MIAVTPHPTPLWRDVLLEQVRIVGLSIRREALVALIVLAAATLPVVVAIANGECGFDSSESFPTPLAAFLFPFAVWRGERRFGSAFLWTLPVDRRRLALTRVFAGGIWAMVALAFFTCWVLALGVAAGTSLPHLLSRMPLVWTLAAYLFGSALVLGLRHPLRWLLGTAGLILLLGVGSDLLVQPNDAEWDRLPGARAWFSFAGRLFAAWRTLPDPTRWTLTTSVLLGGGLAALLLAVSRHRERRPH